MSPGRPIAAVARIAAAALLAAPAAAGAHALLDPEQLRQALADIARAERDARVPGADPEALYDLGERIEAVVSLLDQDAAAHGPGDVLARLVAERLRASGADVRYSEPQGRWSYDLAAFRDYLARAPDGEGAHADGFRLLERCFHESVGTDPSRVEGADAAAVAREAAEEERFLRRHPDHEKAREVRFFLAVDYYRLSRAEAPSRRARYRRLGREALQLVRTRYPGSMEARTAETLLEALARR